jgi:DNA-binding NtrC family response regulator
MMTAYGNIDTAVEAMKRGAVDFLTKPVNIERLEVLIQRALKTKTLEVEVKQLHERLDEKFSLRGHRGPTRHACRRCSSEMTPRGPVHAPRS